MFLYWKMNFGLKLKRSQYPGFVHVITQGVLLYAHKEIKLAAEASVRYRHQQVDSICLDHTLASRILFFSVNQIGVIRLKVPLVLQGTLENQCTLLSFKMSIDKGQTDLFDACWVILQQMFLQL